MGSDINVVSCVWCASVVLSVSELVLVCLRYRCVGCFYVKLMFLCNCMYFLVVCIVVGL